MHLVPVTRLHELKIVEPKTAVPPKEPTRKKAIKAQQSRQKAARTRERKAREARKQAFAKAKAARQARREKIRTDMEAKVRERAGKAPTIKEIPAQIAHCMMALHVKRAKSKEAAWNICRWAMTRNGYLKGPYRKNTKLPKATVQTGKGTRRSFQHGTEKKPLNGGVPGNGSSKFRKFTRMFRDLEPKIVSKRTA